MKSFVGGLSLVALAAALSHGALATGCSHNSATSETGKNEGSVNFNLDVGGGLMVNTLHVVLYGNGLGAKGASTNIVKNLDVSAISGNLAPFALVLAAGSNYQIEVTSPDNSQCLGTSAFSVSAGASATLHLTMSCTPETNPGATIVNVNACSADITSVFVGPNGTKILVEATATPGASFLWSTTGNGTFEAPTAASTNFNCNSVGNPILILTVSGNTTAGAACTASKTFPVSCTQHNIVISDGGSPGAGGSTGGTSGNGGAGGSTGGMGTAGFGGELSFYPACESCESALNLCVPFRPCDRFGTAVDSQGRLKADTCREVLACVASTGCAGVGVEGDCYCGTVSGPACDAGQGNGACRTAIEHGADSTSPSVIQSSFTATTNGGGMALARIVCLNGSACQSACSALSAND